LAQAYNIIILSADSDLRRVPASLLKEVMLSIFIDTAKETVLLECVSQLQEVIEINAVIPGFEYFVPVAARISQHLKLPGIAYEHVMQLRQKDLMRARLKEAGLNTPKFKVVKSIRELSIALDEIGFPAICKPIDAAGSVHVKKVLNKTEAQLAALPILKEQHILWGHRLSNTLLVEEYVEGKEFSLEGVILNGKVVHFSLTEKWVADQYEFIEIGHIVNIPMPYEWKRRIELYVEDVLRALGADHCPFHAEIRLCEGEPILMEVAARLAGDKIGDLINLCHESNYFDYVYAAYLGEALPPILQSSQLAGIRFFYRPEQDKYSIVCGTEATKRYAIEELQFYYQAGETIPAFPKALRRLGHVIAAHHDYHHLITTLNEIDAMLVFQ
jgi:biotin carboxylase